MHSPWGCRLVLQALRLSCHLQGGFAELVLELLFLRGKSPLHDAGETEAW